ncbi:ABC transporter permease [Actinophytocola algeriensis]|uniref:ABC-type nitrate/sulfonate/bicarbonate transport system permease component n=1 Tax=Actinophytocola algeriensis TaxID=1768010 RepID=A0A7W7Q5E6_9PSEU|nr:ABC transporter permease [Actinophytocola algeriensis]MBB4907386.1 ABC-type nitrate/sulfonate/bicarbonate transport system permease component [Actinophytocola algeriensis]MBE1478869.1 ABC-type nitrate/sulfonate/bicarbonate transport system permease component [Actinophytocola algeriensis]
MTVTERKEKKVTPDTRARRGRAIGFLGKWAVFAGFIAAWQVATTLAEAPYFPTPSTIGETMVDLWLSGPASQLWLSDAVFDDVVPSLLRLLGGWAAAGVVGVVLGLMMGRSEKLYDYFSPTISFLRSVPPPALLPVFLVLFPIGTPMQLATIIFGVIWPVLLNTIDGAHTLDETVVETTRSMRLSKPRFLATVVLPAALPKIFAGLRVSLSLALILMVISELVGSTNGIGYQMIMAQRDFSLPKMWAGIVLLGILGYVLNVLLLVIQNRVIGWHTRSKSLTGR